MTSNSDIEMRWVDAWNDVLELAKGRDETPCLFPDGSVLDVEACLGRIQSEVYSGATVTVAAGPVNHRDGIVIAFP